VQKTLNKSRYQYYGMAPSALTDGCKLGTLNPAIELRDAMPAAWQANSAHGEYRF